MFSWIAAWFRLMIPRVKSEQVHKKELQDIATSIVMRYGLSNINMQRGSYATAPMLKQRRERLLKKRL